MPQKRTIENKKRVLDALKEVGGIITLACEKTGIGRRTFYHWVEKDQRFANEVNETFLDLRDRIEARLQVAGLAGQPWAVKFFLSRRHPAYKWKGEIEEKKPPEQIPEVSELEKRVAKIYAEELKKSLKRPIKIQRAGMDKQRADKRRKRKFD